MGNTVCNGRNGKLLQSEYKVIAKEANTSVEIPGMKPIKLLKTGDYETFVINDDIPKFIETSKPVALFFFSGKCTDTIGDASMLMIPPVSNYGRESRFTTSLLYVTIKLSCYVTIVIDKNDKNGLLLDEQPLLNATWIEIEGNSEMLYAEYKITLIENK